MAAMAINVLDLNWRLLVGQPKPCTRRGARFSRCNPRRARGDKCHDRERTGEGSRINVIERITRDDIAQQLVDSVDEPAAEREEPILRGYSQPAYQFEETRRHDDLGDLGDLVVWLPRERKLGIRARAALARLQNPVIFSMEVEKLEEEAEIGDFGVATLLEENDRMVYGHLTGS